MTVASNDRLNDSIQRFMRLVKKSHIMAEQFIDAMSEIDEDKAETLLAAGIDTSEAEIFKSNLLLMLKQTPLSGWSNNGQMRLYFSDKSNISIDEFIRNYFKLAENPSDIFYVL